MAKFPFSFGIKLLLLAGNCDGWQCECECWGEG
uniref:Uncharacterized protein n=1 Tax=Arundo donax TaxID=35708 RepID=A0A0A9G0W0_ARUDO